MNFHQIVTVLTISTLVKVPYQETSHENHRSLLSKVKNTLPINHKYLYVTQLT